MSGSWRERYDFPDAESFRRLYMGEMPDLRRQCSTTGVTHPLDRCPGVAEFALVNPTRIREPIEAFCAQCIPEALRRALRHNESVGVLKA